MDLKCHPTSWLGIGISRLSSELHYLCPGAGPAHFITSDGDINFFSYCMALISFRGGRRIDPNNHKGFTTFHLGGLIEFMRVKASAE